MIYTLIVWIIDDHTDEEGTDVANCAMWIFNDFQHKLYIAAVTIQQMNVFTNSFLYVILISLPNSCFARVGKQ